MIDPQQPLLPETAIDGKAAAFEQLLNRRRADLAARLAELPATNSGLVWEIGCGHGHFLTAYAQAHPDRTCVGIDIASDRIERATRKRDRSGLTNLHFIRAEAGLFLEALPPQIQIADVFILFPDPWPKLRHHKHRIVQREFLRRLARRAGEGSRLFFRTDYEPYYAAACELLCADSDAGWRRDDGESWAFEHETVFQRRAAKYYSLVARPAGSVAPDSPAQDPHSASVDAENPLR